MTLFGSACGKKLSSMQIIGKRKTTYLLSFIASLMIEYQNMHREWRTIRWWGGGGLGVGLGDKVMIHASLLLPVKGILVQE